MKSVAFSAALAVSALTASAAFAQGLPGGATSLNETYGSWMLTCVAPEGGKRCAISHSQQDQQSRQRILAIELATAGDGTASGLLVMPFGLKLANGVALHPASGAPLELAFTTCLPAGCIVPLSLEKDLVASLSQGGAAEIRATAMDSSKPVVFSIPLDGFGNALTRLAELSQ